MFIIHPPYSSRFWAVCLMLFLAGWQLSESQAQSFDFSHPALLKIAEPTSSPKWIKFRTNFTTAPKDVFNQHQTAFKLTQNDQLKIHRIQSDQQGLDHYRFKQYYQDLEVANGYFTIHARAGQALKGNGKIITGLSLSATPNLSSQMAIDQAKKYLPAQQYRWEDTKEEAFLKKMKNDPSATYYPNPILQIIAIANSGSNDQEYKLAYAVPIQTKSSSSKMIFVDAQNGKLLKELSLIQECTPTVGCTLYNGNAAPISTSMVDGNHVLWDQCSGNGIHTFQYTGSAEYTDADNVWTTPDDCAGVSAHFAMGVTHDYFLEAHDRLGYDDAGAMVFSFVGLPEDQAFWNSGNESFTFGGGDYLSTSELVSLDIVGHEYTHAVIDYGSDLLYQGESGALNESFADIFGTAIEHFYEGNDANYLIAEDMWIDDGFLRNMKDPKSKMVNNFNPFCPGDTDAQPDTYEGDHWKNPSDTNCDLGGVHYNSGVQNFWFYLLAEGSSETDGINDNGDSFTLNGIGKEKATAIAYQNMMYNLQVDSDFEDARAGAIQAAIDLFGDCSVEVIETIAAWNAVGVYGPSQALCLCDGDYLDISDQPIFSATYRADTKIQSTGTVLPGSEVKFQAENEILLKAGFTADEDFHAYIENCNTEPLGAPAQNKSNDYEAAVDDPVARQQQFSSTNIKNFPNPFSNQTTFEIQLTKDAFVSLEIMDQSGRIMDVVMKSQFINKGIHQFSFRNKNLANGIYFYKLLVDSKLIMGKMVVSGQTFK